MRLEEKISSEKNSNDVRGTSESVLGQDLLPVGRQDGVRRSGDGVFGDADPRREVATVKVVAVLWISPNGDDDTSDAAAALRARHLIDAGSHLLQILPKKTTQRLPRPSHPPVISHVLRIEEHNRVVMCSHKLIVGIVSLIDRAVPGVSIVQSQEQFLRGRRQLDVL